MAVHNSCAQRILASKKNVHIYFNRQVERESEREHIIYFKLNMHILIIILLCTGNIVQVFMRVFFWHTQTLFTDASVSRTDGDVARVMTIIKISPPFLCVCVCAKAFLHLIHTQRHMIKTSGRPQKYDDPACNCMSKIIITINTDNKTCKPHNLTETEILSRDSILAPSVDRYPASKACVYWIFMRAIDCNVLTARRCWWLI